jgi:UDP-2,4-diacetamido-2,4,6-trideoxy-beta-L-altropyranose hydrolase
MRIVIRSDASLSIGSGHVVRCLTLADGLKEHGASVEFVSRLHPGHTCDLIEAHGFRVHRLPQMNSDFQTDPSPAHAAWLGTNWEVDCAETMTAIQERPGEWNWLVVDHYALDLRWEQQLRCAVSRIMVIDDLADRTHDCDLLVDQNLVRDYKSRYNGKTPGHSRLLLGPEYAILQRAYSDVRKRTHHRQGSIGEILIYFGGVDTENWTGRALSAFLNLNRSDIVLHVVVGCSDAQEQELRSRVTGEKNVFIYSNLPSLASLMSRADLAIGATGTTTWERLCLGLPTIVVALDDNQIAAAEELSRRGLIRWLGHKEKVDEDTIHHALNDLIAGGLNGEWSKDCREIVDGQGMNRVTLAMREISESTRVAR